MNSMRGFDEMAIQMAIVYFVSTVTWHEVSGVIVPMSK